MSSQFILSFLILSFACLSLSAQKGEDEKEIIIIEKVQDEQGNIISKQTKRFSGKYTEEEIQEIIGENDYPMERSYDLEGLGFGDNLRDLFGPAQSGRPTIGVNLNFDDGMATVDKVFRGSGAEKADIRKGDEILSLNGVAISSIDDIYEILDQKEKGDVVKIVIFRDGDEMGKEVVLGTGGANNFFFEFPEEGGYRLFGDRFELDSLFRDLRGRDDLWPRLDDNLYRGQRFDFGELKRKEAPPSLGIFLEEGQPKVIIAEVIEDSPADKAGLRTGDFILRMDDNVVTSFYEVKAYMNTKYRGEEISLEIERRGRPMTIVVLLD